MKSKSAPHLDDVNKTPKKILKSLVRNYLGNDDIVPNWARKQTFDMEILFLNLLDMFGDGSEDSQQMANHKHLVSLFT